MVQMMEVGGRLRMLGVGVDLEDGFHEVWDVEVPLEYRTKAFCEVSVSGSGFVSVLCKFGASKDFRISDYFEKKKNSDERDLDLVSTCIHRRCGVSEYAGYYPAYCAIVHLIIKKLRVIF